MHNLVKPRVVHLVEPTSFEVMLLAIVRPAHRDERMRDERDVVALADVDRRTQMLAIHVRRDALIGRQFAHDLERDLSEPEARNERIEPQRRRYVPVASAGVDEHSSRQLRERVRDVHLTNLAAQHVTPAARSRAARPPFARPQCGGRP